MRKQLQVCIIMLLTVLLANAQIGEVFSDNFDSYTAGVYLGSVTVPTYGGAYSPWKAAGTGNTVNIAVTASKFNSGTQCAVLTASKNNFCSMRKTINVISGHSYTFSAWTNADGVQAANKPSACQLNYQFNTTTTVKGATKDTLSINAWHKQSITFTAATSETVDVFISVYLYAAAINVFNDDWLVIDNTIVTALNNAKNANCMLTHSGNGQFELKGSEVELCKVYSAQGKLVKSFNKNKFNLNNLPKGAYLLSVTDKNGNPFTKKFIY